MIKLNNILKTKEPKRQKLCFELAKGVKMRIDIESFKIVNCYGAISHKDGWSEGFLATPTGIVDILTDYKNKHVRFDACLNGRHYIKTFNEVKNVEEWSDRKLKAQARIFMAEIASE